MSHNHPPFTQKNKRKKGEEPKPLPYQLQQSEFLQLLLGDDLTFQLLVVRLFVPAEGHFFLLIDDLDAVDVSRKLLDPEGNAEIMRLTLV